MPGVFGVTFPALALAVLLAASGCKQVQTVGKAVPEQALRTNTTGSYLIAQQAVKDGDIDAAAGRYREVLAETPDNSELLRKAFLVELERGEIEPALALAKIAKDRGHATSFIHLLLAANYASAGSWLEARNALAELPITRFSQTISPLLQGWVSVGLGDWDEAEEHFQSANEVSGLEAVALQNLGHAARISGENDAADGYFREALSRAEAPHLSKLVDASLHFAVTGRPEMAREILSAAQSDHDVTRLNAEIERISRDEPPVDHVKSAQDGLAVAAYETGFALRPEIGDTMAMIMARIALHLRPSHSLAWILVAQLLDDRGEHAQAQEALARISEDSVFHPVSRLLIASSLEDMGQPDDAVAFLRKLTNERPQDPSLWMSIGNIERSRESWPEAIAAYDEAFDRIEQVRFRHWNLHFARGIALERNKQWDEAEADFLAALALSPDQPYVLNYLGYSWAEQGTKLEAAEELIRKAVELRPLDGYIVDSLGWVYYRTGRFEDAVRELERAVQLKPVDPTINDHLGDAYWRVGRRLEAQFQWRRTLTMEPEAEQVENIRLKLETGLPPLETEQPKDAETVVEDQSRS